MPKMKTHKGAAKRFKKTGSGKLMRKRTGMRHFMTTKNRRRKRRLKVAVAVGPDLAGNMKKLLHG